MKYGQVGILLGCIIATVKGVRFTVEPKNKLAALSKPLWWHCQAEADGIVSYSWKKGTSRLPIRPGQSIFSNGTLLITKVENDDVGSYTCVVESDGQTLSSSEAALELAYINTDFKLSPKSQTTFLGDPVLLQCQIESLPPALITWKLGGGNITKNTITVEKGGESSYRIQPVMYHDAGSYQCEGRNPMLNTVRYSDVGELIVLGPPVFTSSLRSLSIPLGFTATFDCRFEGNPEPQVAWFINRQHADGNVTTREITNSEKYMAFPNGTLVIHDVTDDDVAFYTCRLANSFGEMAESAHLNTSGNPTGPVFTIIPRDQSVVEGGNVTFVCQAESNPDPTVVWMLKGVKMPSVNGHLTITNVRPSDAGIYVCVAENGVGYKNIAATLTVLVGPSFVTKPADLAVIRGAKALLSCQVTGDPTPSITWTTPNSGEFSPSSMEQDGITVSEEGSLMIGYVDRKHHGIYTCTAANEVGSVVAVARISVEVPPTITKTPVSHGVLVGERAMFHCQASGYPTPSLLWSKDGEGMITSSAQRQIYINNSLVIHSVKKGDEGVYKCQAYNTRGSSETSATLTVLVPPSFSIKPTSQKARIGDDVSLDCVAIGDPVPTQKWDKDGRQLVLESNMRLLANGTLVITTIRAHQFGDYTCTASSMVATISTSARIQTEDFPILTVRPSSITVNSSETARLVCKGEALEAPSTNWFRLTGEGTFDVRNNERIIVTVEGEMIIQNVQPSDEGFYQCVVANTVGNVSENAFINVLVPPKITHTNSPQTTVMYADVTLACQSSGDPAPVLHWLNPIGQEVTGSSSYIVIDNTLQIVSASEDIDGGYWTCKACNLLGCDDLGIEVRIEGPPVIHGINSTQTTTSVILNCFTSGVPEPSVVFTHQDQDVTLSLRGHKVIRNSLHVDQDYVVTSYSCKAENRHGRAEEVVSVPSDITSPTFSSSTSRELIISWSAPNDLGGLPLLGYQIEATPDFGKTWLKQDFSFTNGSLIGLTPYTNYQVRVAGVNILGIGIFSDLSETIMTEADAPSPPTNVTVTVAEASILLTWNHSKHFNGDADDIEYRYTVSSSDHVKDDTEPAQSSDGNRTVYHSGNVSANEVMEVILEGLIDPIVYSITVWAVNVQVNKSSEPVIVLADLTVTTGLELASFSPDTVIAIAFGIIGGIIIILVIVFLVTQIRQMKKTRSMSLVNQRPSLDQFYMESPKNLYGKKSKFCMKRSSSQGFYKFDNDESFHGAGSIPSENGSALREKLEDKDVLLTARNPLYGGDTKDLPPESSVGPVNKGAPLEQPCEQAEIEIPQSEYTDNFVLKLPPEERAQIILSSAGSDNHMTKTSKEADLAEIYSISKESEDSHIYEVPNLESRRHSDRETSPSPSSKSNNSKSKPIRVIALEKFRGSPPATSQNGLCERPLVSPLDSPTDEVVGDPETVVFKVQDVSETSLGEDTDLLPHKRTNIVTKKEATLPKDIKVRYDLSEEDLKKDLWSAALY